MSSYDVAVIGSGPGGYVAAIQAAQNGLRTAVIEKDNPGGICLNWGCIPTKSLIHSAELIRSIPRLNKFDIRTDSTNLDYSAVQKESRSVSNTLVKGVEYLLGKNGINLIRGRGRIENPGTIRIDDTSKVIEARSIILATGSRPRSLPGFDFDGETILSSKDILRMKKLPERMIILGGGAIGIEFAHILNTFGVNVVLIEMLDQILPYEDSEIAYTLELEMKKQGIDIRTKTQALRYEPRNGSLAVSIESAGKRENITTDKVLVAVGRQANVENIGFESVGIKISGGVVSTGDYYQTNVPGIYAIGDLAGQPMLAHAASHEGIVVAEHVSGKRTQKRLDPTSIPRAVYCEPQVAGFGITGQAVKAGNLNVRTSTFPFRGCGKAVVLGYTDGFVKIIADASTGEILGASVIGAQATELIHELILAKKAELLPEDIFDTVHAHPTLSEAVMECAKGIFGKPTHI